MSKRVDLTFKLFNAPTFVHECIPVQIIRCQSYILQMAFDSCKSRLCLEMVLLRGLQ